MAQGQARAGLDALDRLGWIKEDGADYVQRAADRYVESVAAKQDTILVAPTWEEIHRLTDAVRTGLKKCGLLGEGQSTTVAEPLAWTKAQAATTANYRPGHLLTLHRPLREANPPAGATVEVVSVARGAIRVRDTYGHEADVAPRRQATSWTASSPRVIELAIGDRILIRQSHRVAGLINGEVLTVTAREPSGVWRTCDAAGREKTIPTDFRAFAHGYAVTSRKAQGRTCDEVIVGAARLDAKATYVAFSRARQQATGYTPDKAALFDALPTTNRPRQAALDVWTPARSRRLRWVRDVVDRVRELLKPRILAPEFALPLPVPQPSLKSREDVSYGVRTAWHDQSAHTAPAVRMRF